MTVLKVAVLSAAAITAWIEPVFASAVAAPGPIAGIGVPALAIIGGAYWAGRTILRRKR